MMIRNLGLALVLVGAFSVSAKAQSSFTIDLYQDGSNVVATGSGDIDLTGLSFITDLTAQADELVPDGATITLGVAPSAGTFYGGISGPGSFGSGGADPDGTNGSGDLVATSGGSILLLPQGYVSGTPLSDSATWDNATLASLGITPGTYTWTWGNSDTSGGGGIYNDSENTLTLNVVAVPEPSQYGWGVLLATLGFVAWRRFSSRATARA
jgi:hypothetical protein